ncbi:zinc finger protein [Saccharopolyspora sp. ID03-671]|uniref:zinc finger protein n=1 Tax=Saccharopolyspora sp. ID03-671 TaxID=3073066 RepID=UPI003245B405
MSRNIRFHWYPVAGARHAFPAELAATEHEAKVQALCGAIISSTELHAQDNLVWITEPTCIRCWDQLFPDDPTLAPVN